MAKLFANSRDLDQMPHSAASDLGLHCLLSTLLQVSQLQLFQLKCTDSFLISPELQFPGKNKKKHFKMSSTEKFTQSAKRNIMKTYLYNFDPIEPHFYILKLGFTGVYTIYLISAKKCFEQKYEKYHNFCLKNFQFLVVKFSIYLNRHVFIMKWQLNQRII